MALKLQIIICSTRPGRVGAAVAQWFNGYAREHSGFDIELIDLAEVNLPLYDEPQHPVKQNYKNEHTKRWSQSVAAADAYVFVAPEYNYSPAPSLINALDYVYNEWNYKPCAFVSYGGISGGLRGAQCARLQTTTLKMMPIPEGVAIPFVAQHIDPDTGTFQAYDAVEHSAKTVLDELGKWARGLKAMRAG